MEKGKLELKNDEKQANFHIIGLKVFSKRAIELS